MAWDKDKIKEQIITLENRIRNVKTQQELLSLQFDCKCLVDIYNMLDHEYPLTAKKVNLKQIANDYRKESMECILENKNDIVRLVRQAEHNPYFHPKCARVKKITEEKYLSLVEEFLKDFDPDLCSTYHNMMASNIHFDKLKNKKANGLCYQVYNLNEYYVVTKPTLNKNFDTLPHEMGHVKDFSNINNFQQNVNFRFSSFIEAFPKFIALLFDEYYQETEYKQVCLQQKRSFFDNLRVTSEIYTSILSNANTYNLDNETFISTGLIENNIPKAIVDSMTSDLMAIYMLNLYKKDRSAFNKLMSNYYRFAGICEEKIWKMLNADDLSNAVKEEVFTFNNDVYKSRKKIKSFNLF